jgi:hypothetical protein
VSYAYAVELFLRLPWRSDERLHELSLRCPRNEENWSPRDASRDTESNETALRVAANHAGGELLPSNAAKPSGRILPWSQFPQSGLARNEILFVAHPNDLARLPSREVVGRAADAPLSTTRGSLDRESTGGECTCNAAGRRRSALRTNPETQPLRLDQEQLSASGDTRKLRFSPVGEVEAGSSHEVHHMLRD